jgi:hypothetical protein
LTGTTPERGSVIRYSYLWADENARGKEEGQKDRPALALVLALSIKETDGNTEVLVLAVTHTPPTNAADAVAFPQGIKRHLGLDDALSWIVTTEANAFIWPGPDIRPVPGRTPTTVIYGRVPNGLLRQVARSYLANRDKQRSRLVPRTE